MHSQEMIRKTETSKHLPFFLLFGVFIEWGLQFFYV